jgi:hypothetical protein
MTLDGFKAEPDNTTKSVLAPQMRGIIRGLDSFLTSKRNQMSRGKLDKETAAGVEKNYLTSLMYELRHFIFSLIQFLWDFLRAVPSR